MLTNTFRFIFVIEILLKLKEEELNSIIVEMRRNCTNLQEKLVKEESERQVRVIPKSVGNFYLDGMLFISALSFLVE